MATVTIGHVIMSIIHFVHRDVSNMQNVFVSMPYKGNCMFYHVTLLDLNIKCLITGPEH